jgi:hypothetical protein
MTHKRNETKTKVHELSLPPDQERTVVIIKQVGKRQPSDLPDRPFPRKPRPLVVRLGNDDMLQIVEPV